MMSPRLRSSIERHRHRPVRMNYEVRLTKQAEADLLALPAHLQQFLARRSLEGVPHLDEPGHQGRDRQGVDRLGPAHHAGFPGGTVPVR